MEPDVPGLLFVRYSAFLFDVAERCIGPKAENNDSAGRADGHSRKNIFFSRKTDWILNLPLEERLRRDREALRKLLSEG